MYEIWADDLLIYSDISPLETVKVIEPRLTLADCAAGSLEMTLPPTNVGYKAIKRMITDIIVKCEGEELWRGRVLTDDYDFWNRRKMVVEGELAYLNDSIQPPHQYLSTETTIETFVRSLIEIHNQNVEPNRQFEVGMITVTDGDQQDDSDAIYRYTNYETTLECFNEKLVDRLGGHLRVRHQVLDGVDHRYIDYISDESIGQNSQIIRFGVNLMDFVKSFDMSELATAIIPRGQRLDEEEIEGLEAYLTVKSLGEKTEINPDTGDTEVWHENGSLYVKNPSAVATYGGIAAVVDWDNVTDPENLYTKAVKYLKDEQYEKMVLEIKAVDLHYAANSNARIKMLDKLRCISEPHGMDHTFPVTQMEIRLDRPDDSLFTLGTDVTLTLTQATSKVNQDVLYKIDQIPSKHSILKAAQDNAFKILMGVDGGYVRFEKYAPTDPHYNPDNPDIIHAIVISDGPTDEESLHKWVWNEGGFGHLHRDTYQDDWTKSTYDDGHGATLDVAITMDGKIVANAITVGVLKAYNEGQGGEVYALDTGTGYIKMLYGEIGEFVFNKISGIYNPFNGKRVLNKNSAILYETQMGCGTAGLGIVNIFGGRNSSAVHDYDSDERYGCIQLSNSGNFYDNRDSECISGIRIYGNGVVRFYDGNGRAYATRNLADIPTS